MKVKIFISISFILFFVGCDKNPAGPSVTSTTYTWSSVVAFTNMNCSGTGLTGHCIVNIGGYPDYSITETNCIAAVGTWETFYELSIADGSLTMSVELKSDNTGIYTVGTTAYSGTYTEVNNVITLTSTSDGESFEFTRDEDSLIQTEIEETNPYSPCSHLILN